MADDTLYELLGVSSDATTDQIRSAYRTLSKNLHPDRGGTAPFFRQLQQAHETLADPVRRADYDRSLLLTNTTSHSEPRAPDQGKRDEPSQATGTQPGGPHFYQRFLAKWSRGIDRFADMTGRHGRRRRQVVVAAWIVSVLLGIYFVVAFVTHDLFFLILMAIGIFIWKRRRAKKLQVESRRRAAQEAASRAQAEGEAKRKQRAERDAAAQRARNAREAAARERAESADRRRAAHEYAAQERAAQAAEAERIRAEREARETEAQQEAAHAAAESGDLDFILSLSPTQFEYTMAALLRMLGMTDVERVGGRGDLGVDITALDSNGRTMVVQCKRYARTKRLDHRTFSTSSVWLTYIIRQISNYLSQHRITQGMPGH